MVLFLERLLAVVLCQSCMVWQKLMRHKQTFGECVSSGFVTTVKLCMRNIDNRGLLHSNNSNSNAAFSGSHMGR